VINGINVVNSGSRTPDIVTVLDVSPHAGPRPTLSALLLGAMDDNRA
jgi:hypothetical protein